MSFIALIFIISSQVVEEGKREAVPILTNMESLDSPKLDDEEATPCRGGGGEAWYSLGTIPSNIAMGC